MGHVPSYMPWSESLTMMAVLSCFTSLGFPRTLEAGMMVTFLCLLSISLVAGAWMGMGRNTFSPEAAIRKRRERISAQQPFQGF